MLEARQALREHRVAAVGKGHGGGEGVGHAGPQRRGQAAGRHLDRQAALAEVPQQQVDIVDRLLEDPRADGGGGAPPVVGAAAKGPAEQGQVRKTHPAQRALGDQLADPRPLPRDAQLEDDAAMAARSLGGRDQALAVGERGRHRLFQQHVLAGLERLAWPCRHADDWARRCRRDRRRDLRARHRACDGPARRAGRAPPAGPRRRRPRPHR